MARRVAPTPACVRSNDWLFRRSPPTRIASPRTSSKLPRIDPVIVAFTVSNFLSYRSIPAMMSSAAFPNVAFNSPPIVPPSLAARASVARPSRPARGTMARPDPANTQIGAAPPKWSPAATGTAASNRVIGLRYQGVPGEPASGVDIGISVSAWRPADRVTVTIVRPAAGAYQAFAEPEVWTRIRAVGMPTP